MKRLRHVYLSEQFRELDEIDLFVIVVKAEHKANSAHQDQLYEAAKALAPILAAEPKVPARRIAFIEARWDGHLELRLSAHGRKP